jgi:hypothetical protein
MELVVKRRLTAKEPVKRGEGREGRKMGEWSKNIS